MTKREFQKAMLHMPIFGAYQTPFGFLSRERACHALMYYALIARRTYEDVVLDKQIVYEGHLDDTANFRQQFTSIAMLYDVTPEEMAKHWPAVNMQFDALELPQLPDEERYRFNRPIEIRTH